MTTQEKNGFHVSVVLQMPHPLIRRGFKGGGGGAYAAHTTPPVRPMPGPKPRFEGSKIHNAHIEGHNFV